MVRLPPLDFIGRFGQQKVASCRSFVCPKRQIIKEMEVVYLSTPLFALCLSVTYARLLATHAIIVSLSDAERILFLLSRSHGKFARPHPRGSCKRTDMAASRLISTKSGERLRAYGRGQPLVAECRFSFSVQSEAMVIL